LRKTVWLAPLTACLLAWPLHASELAVIVLNPANWGGGRPPSEWQVKVNRGKPEIASCSDLNGSCLHLTSLKSSFALERETDVNPYENRYLTWSWKVTELPVGGDFRRAATDDQAAQILLGFADHRVLSYIWDSTAPKGAMENASSIPLLHVVAVVCESGAGETNRWVRESRDVAADYERAYGRPAPRVKGLRIQINSQHTGTAAESYFGEVVFRSKLPE
jgi:hypothetical protein